MRVPFVPIDMTSPFRRVCDSRGPDIKNWDIPRFGERSIAFQGSCGKTPSDLFP